MQTVKCMSFILTNSATWLPPTVFHTSARLTSEQRVTAINVFNLVINCRYIKVSFGFFSKIQEQFLTMVPKKIMKFSQQGKKYLWVILFYLGLYPPKTSFTTRMLTFIFKGFRNPYLAVSQPIPIFPALLFHNPTTKTLKFKRTF